MAKEILINIENQEKRAAIVNDGRLEEFYIEHPQDKTIVGNIYKGKIEAALANIGGAFVDIGLPKKGFLYLNEIDRDFESSDNPRQAKTTKVEKGQEVLVQAVKESFGTKGPRLSTEIGLPGRYLVLMPQENQVGVSRRIENDQERRRLRQILQEMKPPKNMGFIVRTAAEGRLKQELVRDAHFLLKLYQRIEQAIRRKKAPALVYEEYDLTLRVIRDSFTDDVSRLIVDSKDEYGRIRHFIGTFLRYLLPRIELYRGDDLFTDKDIERQVNRIYESKVYLKSKAYIIIEPTEGLVVIDVNSGGFRKKFNQEETAFKVNCEAALEVARQLKLRDLGGIVVVDFIDMFKDSHRRELLNILKRELSKDKAKYDIVGISKFGLVEMTRERVHRTAQMVSYQTCPYCQGRAKIKSALTMSIYVLKELRRFLKGKRLKEVQVRLNPAVNQELLKDRQSLQSIERQFRTRITAVADPNLHVEDINIV